ncbi:MAG: dihydrolipoyl dehydrogenase [Syntrophobacterales bacterium]|nr:dihydrolipoyl dehydrogenase [Syntrophobacterales bacterium]
MAREYDIVVIGAGPGGYAAAEKAARLGARVAVVEKERWGGTCAHVGCIPTKALLAGSRRYAEIKKLERLGTAVSDASFDYQGLKRHKEQMVRLAAAGVRKALQDAGAERLEGTGHLLSSSEVEVTGAGGERTRLRARRVLIAWGSEPLSLPGVRLSDRVMNSDGFLALNRLPASAVVVGGGTIGVEFANFLAELGVRVTLVELLGQILPSEDKDAADFLAGELTRAGVEIYTSTRMTSLEEREKEVLLVGEKEGRELTARAECALIATGRKPLIHAEELDRLGIVYDGRGGIAVTERQETSVENVYAVGDVTGGLLLAHRASAQGRALANHLFGDGEFFYDEKAVPSVVYTHPGLARVGLTEREARALGMDTEIRRAEYGANMTARTELMGNGFVKALFSPGKVCGVTIVGEGASELVAAASLAMTGEMAERDLRKWVLPHPSLGELLGLFAP